MSKNIKIIEEILNKIGNVENLELVKKELNLMDSTEGFNSINNLNSFYNIYKKLRGKKGDKNDINSWTAYYLGMTSEKPNPEKEFLQKRRTYCRAGFPDIDIDFSDRAKIISYAKKKYGEENVSNVGTNGTFKLRSVIKKLVKALDLANAFYKGQQAYVTDNEALAKEILDTLPEGIIKVFDEDGESEKIETVEDAYNNFENFKYYMDKYPELITHSKKLQNLVNQVGTHASGILIGNENLAWLSAQRIAKGPVGDDGKKTTIFSTQISYPNAEKIGLIKFDFLGIANLNVIQECCALIKKNYNIDLDLNELPIDDEKTFKLYREGKTTGVFQCEGWGMKKTLMDIGCDRLEDITAAISLYRPGPMASIPDYCAIKRGQKAANYFHPIIEKLTKPYLESTYSVLCYQEQIVQVCKSLCNFSESESMIMIKAVGKKDLVLMKKYEEKFINGAVKNEVPEDVVKKYWHDFIIPFADYGFNKSHAFSYSYLSFINCYMKANYTEEFFVSQLNVFNERKDDDKIIEIIKDFKNFNLKLAPKSINNCDVEFKLISKKNIEEGRYDSVISPSIMVKGVGLKAAQELCRCKPYKSVAEIAQKTNSTLVTLDCIKGLLEANFFDTLKSKYKKETKKELSDENILHEFTQARIDQKKLASKGIDVMQEGIF